MKPPVISVIFLTYNQESYVRQALRSVLNQDYDDYEIIIGDDDSSDGTPGIIQSEVEGYRGKVAVFSLRGARVLSATTGTGGVDIASLNRGIYVMRAGAARMKFVR